MGGRSPYPVKALALTPKGITDTKLHRQLLLDAYGTLLTDRQREALRLHLDEDWSVTELAQSMGASRAAAHDLLRRGTERLEELETQLGLCRKLATAEQRRAHLERRVQRLELQLARAVGAAG